jgi:DNA replication and repair protein RecF
LLQRLILIRFRLLTEVDIEPSQGFNLVCGANAQGKTSLLEGVHLVSTGRLWRGARDIQGIQEGSETASAAGTLSQSGAELTVQLSRTARKRASINGVSVPKASDLLGRLPTVSFSADDLQIVRGEPSDRRSFLDEELSQIFPSYLRHFASYKRALEQRGALLRRSRDTYVGPAEFEPWEELLVHHGTAMRKMRSEWVGELAPEAAEGHRYLGGGEELALTYEIKDSADSLEAYAMARSEDVARGSTTLGPHRDDLSIFTAGMDARKFGSQGQQRTAVIAVKLAVQALARRALGQPPALLLDDVFSDLDSSRRSRLTSWALEQGGQVFLSCTEPEMAGQELVRKSEIFLVRSGVVTKA